MVVLTPWTCAQGIIPDTCLRTLVLRWERKVENKGDAKTCTSLRVRNSLVHCRCPDIAKVKPKMIFASSKDNLKKRLVGIACEVQGSDRGDIEFDEVGSPTGLPSVVIERACIACQWLTSRAGIYSNLLLQRVRRNVVHCVPAFEREKGYTCGACGPAAGGGGV